MSYQLLERLENLGNPRILVIGDAILDRYIWGDAERVSQEAPVILLRADHDEERLGGAANVANMVRGLEAEVTLASLVGSDADAIRMRRALDAAGVDCSAVFTDPDRPTTVKERYLGRAQNRHPHQMLRVDREQRHPLSAELARQMVDMIVPTIHDYQAILVSDYGKGVCTPLTLRPIILAAREAGVPVLVDPRPGSDYSLYHGSTAVTPNRLETKLATGREIKTIADACASGNELCDMLGLTHAFVTLDSDGIVLATAGAEPQHLPTRKRQVYDITGAGDMVLAMIGVGWAAGIPPADIARLANVAGGLEVERVGVVPIRRDEMLADLLANVGSMPAKICSLDELEMHVAARRRLGQKIVLTNGCFDLLHVGHVTYLSQAAREGDCLVVAINSDDSVRRLNKAPDRPLFSEEHRATMLAALEAVNYVTVFDDATPHNLLNRLKPDVLVKGGTYAHDEIVGWEIVESYGGTVKPLGEIPGVSTTRIVAALREQKANRTPIPAPHMSLAPKSAGVLE